MWNRHRILAVAAVGLCAALWTYACGDGTTDPPPPDPLRATTVTVTPATAELTSLGETVRFTAQVLNQNGQAMAGAPVAWSSSDASVATVDASGLATTAGNGTATITATSGSASGTAAVTVAQTVSTVAVSPAADTLVALGDTVRLTAEASDANGHAVAGAEFTWASGDTAVATVDASGLVTSAGAGQAEVTATASGVAGGAAITVVDPAPTTVAVTPDMVALTALGRTAQLVAEVRDQVGRVMEGVPVAWSSSDTTVATVDSAGLVTAVGGGASTVAASAGEASGEALVTVMQAAGSVVVTPTVDTVALGDTLRLVAEAFDGNGHAIADAEFEWSSSDVSVATVDDSGLVRGVAEGAATITAASGGARGTAAITVENPDRAALVALYNATNGPNWVDNTNWLTDAPLHQWYGVSADASGRVLGLSLSGQSGGGNYRKRHGLSGSVPAELGNLSNLRTLDLGVNRLTGPIPAELGNLAQLRTLWLAGNHLTGTIPTELGNLAHLEALSFSGNRLTGPIPPELGNLGDLRSLYLRNNALSGPIPRNFLELDRLSTFFIVGNEALCVPGSSAFVAWLRGLEYRDGDSLCNAADAAVLGQLYELAGGTGWNRSHGWAGDGALEEWHGVSADSLGHVTALDLTANGLAGQLPPTLGELTRMTELRVADNPGLSGRLPLSLANLSLAELRYAGTGLCVPANQSFEDWLNTISSHDGTGAECAPLSDREILEILYEATGGPDWLNSENWLTDAPLSAWHGVVGDEGRVVELSLSRNNLAGLIPPELGDLASLRRLDLAKNDLEGTIPPELGDLASLGRLDLAENNLEGTIPPELGDLAYMWGLYLAENDLEGTIPPELGRLSRLHTLNLFDNRLAGPIPPGLGNLDRLQWLYLNANDLAGAIPPELGNLDRLQRLYLNANDLAGAIPPELGNLGRLSRLSVGLNNLEGPLPLELGNLGSLLELGLAGNAGLSGALPSTLTRLGDLEALVASGTNLCAPRDPGFRRWLDGVETRHVKLCDGGGPAAAYLVQAVQSRELPVPLVARREALLRIFVTAAHDNNERLPPVRASFYHGGALAHVADIAAGTGRIPTEVDEGSLAASANVTVPAEVVLPDLEMVIEIDPDGTLDSGLGVAKRIPETGRLPVEVREMPRFELTLIPFIWTEAPDSTILDAVTSTVADPEEWLWGRRPYLPVGDLVVRDHEPVMSSSNNGFDLLRQTKAIRAMEGGSGYFMGTMARPVTGPSGVATLGGWNLFSLLPGPTAHELGHSFNLRHAPCGGAGSPDPAYPYSGAQIGAWGYDPLGGVVPPTTTDIMSYCGGWISDYHYANALRHRLIKEGAPAAAPATALMLWGGIDADGAPFLEPAFVVDAPPTLPDSAGSHRLTGRTGSGAELFSFSFAMPEVADGDGSSGFAFAFPGRSGWEALASVTLSGPGGSVTLDGDSDRPIAILRDPRNGQVRAILRDVPDPARAQADAASALGTGPGLEVLFSRGIPSRAAWRP